jgi:hypothetical protein
MRDRIDDFFVGKHVSEKTNAQCKRSDQITY